MFNIHIEPHKRLFALQITLCALAIVLLMQVGSRFAEPVILSGQVNHEAQYGPATSASSSSIRVRPGARRRGSNRLRVRAIGVQ